MHGPQKILDYDELVCMIFSINYDLNFLVSLCAEMYGEQRPLPFETELSIIQDTVTSPVYTSYPAMEYYYADSE